MEAEKEEEKPKIRLELEGALALAAATGPQTSEKKTGGSKAVAASLEEALKWTPRPPTVDPPIPSTIGKLSPKTHHLLGDVLFFEWYRTKMEEAYKGQATGMAAKIEPMNRVVRREKAGLPETPDADMRQQLPSGQVVGSAAELSDGAKRILPVLRKKLVAALEAERLDANRLVIRIKPLARACQKADRKYGHRSPGPPASWVHDAVAARIHLPTEAHVVRFVEALQGTGEATLDKQLDTEHPIDASTTTTTTTTTASKTKGGSSSSSKHKASSRSGDAQSSCAAAKTPPKVQKTPTKAQQQDTRRQSATAGATNKGVVRIRNRFAEPRETGYRSVAVWLRLKFPKAAGFFVCEVELSLQCFQELNTRLQNPQIHVKFRKYLESSGSESKERGSETTKLGLLSKLQAEYRRVADDRLEGMRKALDDIRGADVSRVSDMANAASLLEAAGDFEAAVPLRERTAALVLRQTANARPKDLAALHALQPPAAPSSSSLSSSSGQQLSQQVSQPVTSTTVVSSAGDAVLCCSRNWTRRELARVLFELGNTLLETRRYFKAARILGQAMELHTAEGGEGHETARISERRGLALACAQRHAEATETLESTKALVIRRSALLGQICHNLGYVAAATGDRVKAEAHYAEAAKIRADACGADSFCHGLTLYNLANALAANRKLDDAALKYEAALAILAKSHRPTGGKLHGASDLTERAVYEACAVRYAKVLLANFQGNVDKARDIFANVRITQATPLKKAAAARKLDDAVSSENDDDDASSDESSEEEDDESSPGLEAATTADSATPKNDAAAAAAGEDKRGNKKTKPIDQVAPFALPDAEFEAYLLSLTTTNDVLSFAATDDFDAVAAAQNPAPQTEGKASRKKSKSSAESPRNSLTPFATMTLDAISEARPTNSEYAASTAFGVARDEHRTTRMVVLGDDDDDTTTNWQTSQASELTSMYSSVLGGASAAVRRRSSGIAALFKGEARRASSMAAAARKNSHRRTSDTSTGTLPPRRPSAPVTTQEAPPPTYEFVQGGATGANAALNADDQSTDKIDAFPPGSFVIYDNEYRGVVEQILGSGQFGMVHRFCDVTTTPPSKVAMKSLSSGAPAAHPSKGRQQQDGAAQKNEGGQKQTLKESKFHKHSAEKLERMICQEAGICFAIGTHANVVSMRRVLAPLEGVVCNFPHVLVFSDLVEGRTLSQWMGVAQAKKTGRVRTECLFEGPLYSTASPSAVDARITALVAQLYLGIHHMHSRAVIHQDIKPDNCMVTPSYWLRITDYGLASNARRLAAATTADEAASRDAVDELIDPTLLAPLKGGSPAYMSPEALEVMESTTAVSRLNQARASLADALIESAAPPTRIGRDCTATKEMRRKLPKGLVTPATSDLWSAAVVAVELYARRAFKRVECTALEELGRLRQAEDATVWNARGVSVWAQNNGFKYPEVLVRKNIDGATLGSVTERKLASLLSSACPGDARETESAAKELVRLRSTLVWTQMPDIVARVLEKALQPAVEDRFRTSSEVLHALGCDVIFGRLESAQDMIGMDAAPDEAKRPPAPHDEHNVRQTLGSIARLFTSQHRWSLAIGAYAEWMGIAHGELREEATREISDSLSRARAGAVRSLDLSRAVKEHWLPLDTKSFVDIFTALGLSEHAQHVKSVDLGRQDGLESTLQPLLALRKLRYLNLAHCSKLKGNLDPLGDMVLLEHLDLTGCKALDGTLEYLAPCRKLKRLFLDDCHNLQTTLAPAANFRDLTLLRINTQNKMLLTGPLAPLAKCPQLLDLQLRECKRLEGTTQILTSMVELQRLDLSYTDLQIDLADLSPLVNLELLALSNCHRLTGNLESLAGLHALQVLDLHGAAKVEGNLQALSRCTSLVSLDLHACAAIEGELASLKNCNDMEILVLDECKGLQGDLLAVSAFADLAKLNLSATYLSGSLDPLERHANLRELRLELCEQLEGSFRGLADCVRLKTLVVRCHNSKTDFEGSLEPLASCVKLQRLRLISLKKLTGDLAPLANLTELLELSLEGCSKLSGTVEPLSNCRRLEHLNLGSCVSLTGGLEPLAALTRLTINELNLQMCKKLQDLKQFAHYQAKYPMNSVERFFEDRNKTSASEAARARKFLGY